MSTDEASARPATLWIAHKVLQAAEPARGAPRNEWVTYYRHSARVYAEVAEVDRGHHHEALYWVGRMERKATELQEEIDKKQTKQDGASDPGQGRQRQTREKS